MPRSRAKIRRTVTQLASQGRKCPRSKAVKGRKIAKALYGIRRFASFCEETSSDPYCRCPFSTPTALISRGTYPRSTMAGSIRGSNNSIPRPEDNWSRNLDSSAASAVDSTSKRADYERASRGC